MEYSEVINSPLYVDDATMERILVGEGTFNLWSPIDAQSGFMVLLKLYWYEARQIAKDGSPNKLYLSPEQRNQEWNANFNSYGSILYNVIDNFTFGTTEKAHEYWTNKKKKNEMIKLLDQFQKRLCSAYKKLDAEC